MMFNFDYPWILLLIPAAAAFIIISAIGLRIVPNWKKRALIPIRIVLLTLVILCLSGFGIKMDTGKTANIFLVDVSDSSARNKTAYEQIIKTSLKSKSASDEVGIVCFGNDSAVELPLAEKPDFFSFQTKIDSSFTNIEQALQLTSSLFPVKYKKRIILLSDGKENVGDAIKQASILKQKNIVLNVMTYGNQEKGEVQVKDVTLPENMKLNDRFELSVNIVSTVNTKGILKMFADRSLISNKNIEIQKGENNFVFSDIARKGGLVTYTAEIVPAVDTITENNKLSAFSNVEDIAKLLLLQDNDKQAAELDKILEKNADIKVMKPENAPTTVAELQKYDGFIISDVSAEKLDNRFLASLETCIKYQGKGLLVTGGMNSYAPGGYTKTQLEEVLPVNMGINPTQNDRNLGLAIIIDQSGSMNEEQYGVSKIELAKEAAMRSTEMLDKNDRIGIIGFNENVDWIIKMQNAKNLKSIQGAISDIGAGGDTELINPLKEGYQALKKIDTRYKHIILLTDGEAEKTGYDELLKNIKKDKITLSTVAVGYAADKKLLSYMAQYSGGRFYATDQFTNIPKIFTKETIIAKKKYINNRTFTPSNKSNSDMLKGVDNMPQLKGYISTTAKSTAKVILTSDQDDPILASWQYGLGHTVAWTSDAAGIWTGDLMKWKQSSQFWRNIVSYIIQRKSAQDYTLKTVREPGETKIELILSAEEVNIGDNGKALLISPSGKQQSVDLYPTSPGTYVGKMNVNETGVYTVNINVSRGKEIVKSINTAIIMPYSPEYDITQKDTSSFIERLAYEGGGSVLKNTGDIFKGRVPPISTSYDMTNVMLVISVFLLLIEISMRRLNLDFSNLKFIRADKNVVDKNSEKKNKKQSDFSLLLEKKKRENQNQ